MPNIALLLKDEISRLARKEVRGETVRLQKAVSSYRSEIAALKRRIADLEKSVKRSAKPATAAVLADEPESGILRFRAEGLAKHRRRLGLSAADAGRLLGVSSLSVYNWESGKAVPRRSYLPAIAALRGMGKREAAVKLEALSQNS